MKKIIALITAVLLTSAIFIITVSATEDPGKNPPTVIADPYWNGTPSWGQGEGQNTPTIEALGSNVTQAGNSDTGQAVFKYKITNRDFGGSGSSTYAFYWDPDSKAIGQVNNNSGNILPESIVIPSSINGVPVERVFYRLFGTSNETIKYVVVSEGITDMARGVQFQHCKALLGIKLPSTLTRMGINTFDGCIKLQSIELPDELTAIGTTSFKDCTALTTITIPALVGTLKADCFNNCTGLETVIFKGATNAESTAFTSTSNLKNIVFLGNTAPTGTLTGFSTAGANGAVKVYYPAGGTGFDASAFTIAFRTGTTFVEYGVSLTGGAAVGAELTGSFTKGHPVSGALCYFERSDSSDFEGAELIGEKTALPASGSAMYEVVDGDVGKYVRFCVEAFGKTFISSPTEMIGSGELIPKFEIELTIQGSVKDGKFDITSGIGNYGASAKVYNSTDEEVAVALVSAWYKNNQLIDVRLNSFEIDAGTEAPSGFVRETISGDTIQPGSLDELTLKIFAFNSMNSMAPFTATSPKVISGTYNNVINPPNPNLGDGGLYTDAQYDFVKEKIAQNQQPWLDAYNLLISDAEAWINEVPSAVTTWSVPDYYGADSGVGHKAATKNMLDDLKSAYACGLAYKFTGLTKYADQTVRILDNWAEVTTAIDTARPDSYLVSGTAGGGFGMSAELIKDYAGWTNKADFDTWLRNVFLTFPVTSQHNNWEDWTRFTRLTIKAYLDMDITSEVEGIKENINNEINVLGDLPNETSRAENGMWYTYFSLAPKTAAAQIIYNTTGEDIFNYTAPNGRNLKLALDRFLTFCENRGGQGSGQVIAWPYNGGTVNYANPVQSYSWPFPLYEAMAGIYGDERYANFTQALRPLYGPYNSGYYHHIAFFYPTLMFNSVVID